MSKTAEHRPVYIPTHEEVFEFSENERLFGRVSMVRFWEIVGSDRTRVHNAEVSNNNYGVFLFVTTSRRKGEDPTLVTFWGLGWHDFRERWLYDTWFYHRSDPLGGILQLGLSKAELRQVIQERIQEIEPYIHENTQSRRGRLFEEIANLSDDDATYADLMDGSLDWLLGEG